MSLPFSVPISVVRRERGTYNPQTGMYAPAFEPSPITIMGSVHPAERLDRDVLKTLTEGRRSDDIRKLITDVKLNTANSYHPGDILYVGGDRYILASVADNTLGDMSVSHYKYVAIREIEVGPGEHPL